MLYLCLHFTCCYVVISITVFSSGQLTLRLIFPIMIYRTALILPIVFHSFGVSIVPTLSILEVPDTFTYLVLIRLYTFYAPVLTLIFLCLYPLVSVINSPSRFSFVIRPLYDSLHRFLTSVTFPHMLLADPYS